MASSPARGVLTRLTPDQLGVVELIQVLSELIVQKGTTQDAREAFYGGLMVAMENALVHLIQHETPDYEEQLLSAVDTLALVRKSLLVEVQRSLKAPYPICFRLKEVKHTLEIKEDKG